MSDRPAEARQRAGAAPAGVRVQYAIVPVPMLSLDTVSRRSGLHPDLVRRFVALGLVDADRDPAGRLTFAPTAPAALARVQRLRTGLCLNYASIGLVLDLLDRISLLEAALRRAGTRSDSPPWT
ncbi:chaperone modulator CbpM [Streptomyces sp. NPDC005917]|uniref:chaperone modulator CbpM n=1 Tax=unclassified Streptomyces TaxID=2593676 RepID=UPI0033EAC0A0